MSTDMFLFKCIYLSKHVYITMYIDLFGDYGLTGLSLVKDVDGQSKGFAFLEVS
jgi:hypothetical protein